MRLASRAAAILAAAYASAITLPGAVHAAPVARSYFGARLEPRSQVLVGAGQVSVDDFKAFAGALRGQANPVIFMDYVDLHSSAIPAFFEELKGKLASIPWYCVPQIGLGFDDDSGKPYDDRVAAGAYDVNIRLLAHCLKELGRPTFLRIGYEFHGTWNGYSPASYRAAFVRVVAALRSEGASQVASVWCAEAGSLPEDYLKYYPGDESVDWWAIDLFDKDHFSRPMLGRFMEDSRARRKPVMIGESTCRMSEPSMGPRRGHSGLNPILPSSNPTRT